MTDNLPVEAEPAEQMKMNRALALWFDDNFFTKAKTIATYMSKAEGFTPKHLVNKPEACFLVVELALNWNLSPSRVAACTYVTPNGAVGFEGKLIHAIIEATGRLQGGGVTYEHFYDVTLSKGAEKQRVSTITPALNERKGKDEKGVQFPQYSSRIAELQANGWSLVERHGWDKIQGKFEMKKVTKQGSRGSYDVSFAAPAWNPTDEQGLGVVVRAHIKGEVDPRKHAFLLIQAQPRNSTLWATDPQTQICYLACRRFGNLTMPHVLMGVPFDGADEHDAMMDVTPPRPDRADFVGTKTSTVTDVPEEDSGAEPEPKPPIVTSTMADPPKRTYKRHDILDAEGKDAGNYPAPRAAALLGGLMAGKGDREIVAIYEHNANTIAEIEAQGIDCTDMRDLYAAAEATLTEMAAAAGQPAHDAETGEIDEGDHATAGDPQEADAEPETAEPSPGGYGAEQPIRAHAAFWAGASYIIPFPVNKKGRKDGPQWDAAMRQAAMDAQDLAEFTKLDTDNKKTGWDVYALNAPSECAALRKFFAGRAQELMGAEG